ncbi:hypothetical protein GBAR_LOCUS21608 [Geodia barretti]|uniref:Uncharacterized protein n=1 Tax=Geodia barretti TaxID=519541 RepID=A0AA35T121_GEOBA|nr:hypothetical protein GBAR_LOCUS21608 [Geodia barretti]
MRRVQSQVRPALAQLLAAGRDRVQELAADETHRVISSVALHKTMGTKMSELDSKYDRMLDAADSTNPRADPNYYLSKATPLSEGTPD